MEDNLGAVGWELTDEEMQRLNEVSQVELPYPYNFLSRYSRKR
jgi:diketogulonate reductase-like aldo/keto reductase